MLTSHEVFMFGCLVELITVVSSYVVCTRVDCLYKQSGTGWMVHRRVCGLLADDFRQALFCGCVETLTGNMFLGQLRRNPG